MPRFVPVTNTELPKAEQESEAHKLQKHRKWDNPHSIITPNQQNRRHDGVYECHRRNRYEPYSKNRKEKPDTNNFERQGNRTCYYNPRMNDEFDYVPPKRRRNPAVVSEKKLCQEINEDPPTLEGSSEKGPKELKTLPKDQESIEARKDVSEHKSEEKLMKSMGFPRNFNDKFN